MAPKKMSRYEFCRIERVDGVRRLTERVLVRFVSRSDSTEYVASDGDTWWHLAHAAYEGLTDRPAGLWWVLADFQPVPVVDPTLKIEAGTVLQIPSWDFIQDVVFASSRRLESA